MQVDREEEVTVEIRDVARIEGVVGAIEKLMVAVVVGWALLACAIILEVLAHPLNLLVEAEVRVRRRHVAEVVKAALRKRDGVGDLVGLRVECTYTIVHAFEILGCALAGGLMRRVGRRSALDGLCDARVWMRGA
jgi:hypothetical protein